MSRAPTRDHGGGLDAALAEYGGARGDWLDLSTCINPTPYQLPALEPSTLTDLPDAKAQAALETAARSFWQVPNRAEILAANGASALIAMMPHLASGQTVSIPSPTYNEHAAAFAAQGWSVLPHLAPADVLVLVHPNNPDGKLWRAGNIDPSAYRLVVIDESFCDVTPTHSLCNLAHHDNVVILKSFGKFWGLAGVRLGFAISAPAIHARLKSLCGPWPVSGAALAIGAAAMNDDIWASVTRDRLAAASARLDAIATAAGWQTVGGTDLFRLYETPDAAAAQNHLAKAKILSRIFPYSKTWIRLGLPGSDQAFALLQAALKSQ